MKDFIVKKRQAIILSLASATMLWTSIAAPTLPLAQAQFTPPPSTPPPPPIMLPPPPPPPQMIPPPPPPPPVPPPFIVPVNPNINNFHPPIVNPLDVTNPIPNPSFDLSTGGPSPLAGVAQTNSFPGPDDLNGPNDFILVQGDPKDFRKETAYLVTLLHGTVLTSVRKPSQVGMMITPVGDIAFSSNSDAFISFENGILRVRNVDGLGENIKVRITSGPNAGHSYAIGLGYELVISDHKLERSELRPSDGILRRRSEVVNEGFGAVSQFNVEHALQESPIVAQMQQTEGDAKTKRVLADMSRMAAVLNHVNGYEGFAH
jgi:hypothetical protein